MKRISNLYSTKEVVLLSNEDTMFSEQTTSKGNQIKWTNNGRVYKADALGYEGLAEALVSEVLHRSNVEMLAPITDYKVCTIMKQEKFGVIEKLVGCYSNYFLTGAERLITIDTLFENHDIYSKNIYTGKSTLEFIESFVDTVVGITKLNDFGKYLTMLLEIDAVVLNTDRHTNNIAVIKTGNGYRFCDVFDNGLSLLADLTVKKNVGAPINIMAQRAKSKPFSTSFSKQVSAAEQLYGKQLELTCDPAKINRNCMNNMSEYDENIKRRAMSALLYQLEKYYPIYGK